MESIGVITWSNSPYTLSASMTLRMAEKSPGMSRWNVSENFDCISSAHWVARPFGHTTSVRRTSPRVFSSSRMSPASMVLPKPTSSASR